MEPYFSNSFASEEMKIPTYKQILHVRAVDFMNAPSLDSQDDTWREQEVKFTVRFSNASQNRKNIPISKVFKRDGSFDYTVRDITETDPFYSAEGIPIPPYQHVCTVELKGISFPYITSPVHSDTEQANSTDNVDVCYCLDIPEFNGRVHSSVNNIHESFAVIFYDTTTAPVGTVKPMKGIDFDQKLYIPPQPIRSLNKFDVIFRNSNGDIVKLKDFGESSARVSELIKSLYKVILLFEFTIKA